MSSRTLQPSDTKKRRTTLTLPAETLAEAQRIARARQVTLSTVIAEALAEGLRFQTRAERSEEIVNGYIKAFSGFTEDEMEILSGVILEPETQS
jgi:predicted transcriptional regulator